MTEVEPVGRDGKLVGHEFLPAAVTPSFAVIFQPGQLGIFLMRTVQLELQGEDHPGGTTFDLFPEDGAGMYAKLLAEIRPAITDILLAGGKLTAEVRVHMVCIEDKTEITAAERLDAGENKG